MDNKFLHRCSDGAPCYYLDEDGGPCVMGYTLDGQWAFYLDDARDNAYAPDGRWMFYIDNDEYFRDASGTVLYCDGKIRPRGRRESKKAAIT